MSDLAYSPARPALIGWLAVLATVTIWAVWAVATRRFEQLIRSYDPCISCAAHFLDLAVEAVP